MLATSSSSRGGVWSRHNPMSALFHVLAFPPQPARRVGCSSGSAHVRRTKRWCCGMGKHRSQDVPGDFDIYLLAQTWAPQFCCTKSDRCTTVSCALLCQLTLMLTVTLTLTPTRSAGPTRPGTSRCTASGQRTRCHATRVVTVRHRLRPTVP